MEIALFIVGGLVFFAAIFYAAASYTAKVRRGFEATAQRLGFALPETPARNRFGASLEASGVIRGKSARLFTFSTGSGKSRVTWMALSMQPRASGDFTFKIAPQSFGSKIAEFFGAKEITVGDPAFDEGWFVQTNRPDFLRAALLPELRQKFIAFRATGKSARSVSFTCENGVVVYQEAGDFGSEARCQRIVAVSDLVSDLADLAEVAAQHREV